jgi:hypothetical protein
MSYLYTPVQNDQGTFSNDPKNLAKKMVPNAFGGDLDVITRFPWTNTPLTSKVIEETPYIKLKEFYLLNNYLDQIFKAYGKTTEGLTGGQTGNVANAFLNPFTLNGSERRLYEGLYDHINPTGFTYTFPHFTTDYLNTNNSWTAKPFFSEVVKLQKLLTGLGAGAVAGIIGGIASIPAPSNIPVAAARAAAVSKAIAERGVMLEKFTELASIGLESPIANLQDPAIDKPHIWSTSTPRTFTVTFPLYNILTQPRARDWSAQIVKNWELCHLLCYQNLYNKRNLFTGIPPVFYEIDIPGIHYSKAGYVNNLQILNAGNIRKLNLPINNVNLDVNVPDAYIVNLTITDFFIPSKNFMSSIGNSNKGILTEDFISNDSSRINILSQEDLEAQSYPYGGDTGGRRDIPGDLGCWVAREVYGTNNYKWIIFRNWLYGDNGPSWLQKIYTKHGEKFAKFISNKPIIKNVIKGLMDIIVNKHV